MEDVDFMGIEAGDIMDVGLVVIIIGGVIDGSSAGRWSSRIVCGRQNC